MVSLLVLKERDCSVKLRTKVYNDLHVKVDDDVDGEGRVAAARVGSGEGSLRSGRGRVPAAHSSRVQRLLVLADRAPGRPDQTPVEGGDGIQGLWII